MGQDHPHRTTKLTKEQYEEVALVLENEGAFYARYISPSCSTYGGRRALIGDWIWKIKGFSEHIRRNNTVEDRDQLRRYFDAKWNLPQTEINKYADIPSVWDEPAETPAQLNPRHKPLVEKLLREEALMKYIRNKHRDDTQQVIYSARRLGYSIGEIEAQTVLAELLKAPADPHARLRAALREGKTVEFETSLESWGKLQDARPERTFTYPPERYRIVEPEPQHVVVFAPDCPIPIPSPEYLAVWQGSQPAPKENDMTRSIPIEITTKTFMNGVDLGTRPDAEIYDAIAQQEADIKLLEAIENKPKKLVAEIAKRKAGIAALVAHLDSKEA